MNLNDRVVVAILDCLRHSPNFRQNPVNIKKAAATAYSREHTVPRREIYHYIYNKNSRNVLKEQIGMRIRWLKEKGIIEEIRYGSDENSYKLSYAYLTGANNDETEQEE